MAKVRNPIQAQRDRVEVARLYLQGYTQLQIADKLEIDQSTVCRDLQVIKRQWRQEALGHANELIQAELERLRLIEQQAWDAWNHSRQNTIGATVHEQLQEALGGNVATRSRTDSKVGENSYLETILKVIQQRVKILGLDANTQAKANDIVREQINDFLRKLRSFLSDAEWQPIKNFILANAENSPAKMPSKAH